jgi:DNA-binding XRE family transcriptional regulator
LCLDRLKPYSGKKICSPDRAKALSFAKAGSMSADPRKYRRPNFFKQWRAHRGLSQEHLAERLDTSVASVSRIETGRQPYTQDYLEALASVLQTDPVSLRTRDPSGL